MNRSLTFVGVLGILLAAITTASAAAALRPAPKLQTQEPRLGPRAGCTVAVLSCGQTVDGTLATTDCQEPAQGGGVFYDDFYQFTATAGQQVAVSLSSQKIDTYLILQDGSHNSIVQDDDGGGGTNSRASFTVPTTGTYFIVASSAQKGVTGPYSLTLFCAAGGASTCTQDANTLCLNGNRFQVTAIFKTPQQNGAAEVVKLTDDTGYLWFFNASNVETVLKVLNGCTLGGHYWFFAGGLTNVYTQIRVTDTTTGFTRVYTNPLNEAFQPIQDTSAFAGAVCQ